MTYIFLCVPCYTPDDGQRNCPKQVEFYSRKEFEKLAYLVSFIIRIYIYIYIYIYIHISVCSDIAVSGEAPSTRGSYFSFTFNRCASLYYLENPCSVLQNQQGGLKCERWCVIHLKIFWSYLDLKILKLKILKLNCQEDGVYFKVVRWCRLYIYIYIYI